MEPRKSAALEKLASLFRYPGADYSHRVSQAREALEALACGGEDELRVLEEAVKNLDPTSLEEIYTSTFDLNPQCALEVGWHLWGEDYNRGRFLARMRREMASLGVDEQGELPDHLSCLLRLLSRMENSAAHSLAQSCVLPAVDKMLASFDKKPGILSRSLEAAQKVLAQLVPAPQEVAQNG